MSNIFSLGVSNDIKYTLDDAGCVVGVSHDRWPFIIMRDKSTRTKTALVCKDTGDAFGEIDSNLFNDVVYGWILVDNPKLLERDE